MALITCYECNKEISDEAKTCPSCGAKKKATGIGVLPWIFVVMFVFVVIVAVANKNSETYPTAEDSVKKFAASHLKDPDSARFGDISLRKSPRKDGLDDFVACGTLSGKNSFGGYAGMSRFVITGFVSSGKTHLVGFNMEDSSDSGKRAFEKVVWDKNCL